MAMTGSPRINHHDEMGPKASGRNLPPLLRHTAASVLVKRARARPRRAEETRQWPLVQRKRSKGPLNSGIP